MSAAAVLTRYPHLEDIPASARAWDLSIRSAAVLATSLREHLDLALLFRELATLSDDVPLSETADDLRWRGVPRVPFEALAEQLAAPQLVGRVHRWAD